MTPTRSGTVFAKRLDSMEARGRAASLPGRRAQPREIVFEQPELTSVLREVAGAQRGLRGVVVLRGGADEVRDLPRARRLGRGWRRLLRGLLLGREQQV